MKLWEHLTKRSCRLEISRPERNGVRQIIRKWYPGAPHLIWWSFQAIFSLVSSFVSFYDQVPNPKVLKFKIASMEQESDQFRLALDVKVHQLDLWHSSHVLFWNGKVELKFDTKFLFCMCSCVWKKISSSIYILLWIVCKKYPKVSFLNCLNFMPDYHQYHSWSRSFATQYAR